MKHRIRTMSAHYETKQESPTDRAAAPKTGNDVRKISRRTRRAVALEHGKRKTGTLIRLVAVAVTLNTVTHRDGQ